MSCVLDGKIIVCPKCQADVVTFTMNANGLNGVKIECDCGFRGKPVYKEDSHDN